MRKCLTLVLTVLAVVVLSTGCKNKPPLVPIRPVGPDSLSPNTVAEYKTVTTDPNKDRISYVFRWSEVFDDTTATHFYETGDTAEESHSWPDTGTFAVRVKAQDSKGNWSVDWSDTHLVVVTIGANRPPDRPPTPVGPDSGRLREYHKFSTSATDANGDSVSIQFIWDEGNTSLWSPWATSGTTVLDSAYYVSGNIKHIRAVARDRHMAVSETSEAKVFRIINSEPGQTTITGPARGIPNGPHYRFRFSATDPQDDSIRYRIHWGDGDSTVTPYYRSSFAVLDSHVYRDTGIFVITARAQDQLGLVSVGPGVDTFDVVGEGEIIWGLRFTDDFISSPALGTAQSEQGESRFAVIIGANDGYFIGIDAFQGTVLFEKQILGAEGFKSSPVLSSTGKIYLGSESGAIYAFDLAGDSVWRYAPTIDDQNVTMVLSGNDLYCGGLDRTIRKIRDNGTSAESVWARSLREEIFASPALGPNNRLIAADDSGYVYSLNPVTGDTFWVYNTGGDITSSPAIGSDGTVYIAADSVLYAISADGGLVWPYGARDVIISSPVIGPDNNIYFGDEAGYLHRLDSNGNSVTNWPVQVSLSAIPSTPAISADGIIYALAENDTLYTVAGNGTPGWKTGLVIPGWLGAKGHRRSLRMSVDELWPSPVIDRYGIIYVASNVDGVFAIAGRSTGTLAQSPWPMFHHDIRHTGNYIEH